MLKHLVKRSNRKTIAIEIRPNGEIWVRAPIRASHHLIETFLDQKSTWIKQKLAVTQTRKLQAPLVSHQFAEGETFLYLGNSYPLKIVLSQHPELIFSDVFLLASQAQTRARDLMTHWYQQQARVVFMQRIDFYSPANNLSPSKVRISSARTRWGSCNSRGTISLVWRLIMAPLEIVDYVIVHELTHLRIQNHSSDFWRAVEAILPDYSRRRKWLLEYGISLDLI